MILNDEKMTGALEASTWASSRQETRSSATAEATKVERVLSQTAATAMTMTEDELISFEENEERDEGSSQDVLNAFFAFAPPGIFKTSPRQACSGPRTSQDLGMDQQNSSQLESLMDIDHTPTVSLEPRVSSPVKLNDRNPVTNTTITPPDPAPTKLPGLSASRFASQSAGDFGAFSSVPHSTCGGSAFESTSRSTPGNQGLLSGRTDIRCAPQAPTGSMRLGSQPKEQHSREFISEALSMGYPNPTESYSFGGPAQGSGHEAKKGTREKKGLASSKWAH